MGLFGRQSRPNNPIFGNFPPPPYLGKGPGSQIWLLRLPGTRQEAAVRGGLNNLPPPPCNQNQP